MVFAQVETVDYSETCSQVAKLSPAAVAANLDLYLHEMDVRTAFLNDNLAKDVYMEQPISFENGDTSMVVCKLNEELNALKRTPC